MSNIEIVSGQNHIDEVIKLFQEYKDELKVDISFQPTDETAEEIVKIYDKIYIALNNDEAAGCIAFHKMSNDRNCEFKRLYVRKKFRGFHIGKLLLQHAIDESKKLNYNAIYLDTLSTLEAACRMYESFGFKKIEAYYHNPLPDVCYYKLDL
ncbi:MAG: GNAT family N-acetyltransferase [Selenomonadaceae bacterium]|nr:GNAT family N-acetyltransferase [Selenomonadaceae bacterium]